ncbi:hypothetical protein SSX86_011867 [Deinandra increscens subsp. villosa]|uniref:EF-hand domain-containing protein n=1 Tax=Deinandra increscens subsp. villosa TaxID=3103831 RepID=A0AAP0H008_9ASTR
METTPTTTTVGGQLKSSSFRLRSPSLNSVRLRRIFDLFDTNHDELITVDELSRALILLGLDTNMNELDSVIKTFIRDGNSGLTFDDFQALHKEIDDLFFRLDDSDDLGNHDEDNGNGNGNGNGGVAGGDGGSQEEADLTEAFKVFDEDGDGYISATELQAVLVKLGFAEGNEIGRVEMMISSVDRNHDGRVDFMEFKEMMRNLPEDYYVYGSNSPEWSQVPDIGSTYDNQPQHSQQYNHDEVPRSSWAPHVGSDYDGEYYGFSTGPSTVPLGDPSSPPPMKQEHVSDDDGLASPPHETYKIRPPDVDYSFGDLVFMDSEEVYLWAKQLGFENGYSLGKRRTKRNKGSKFKYKVWICCDRGREPESTATMRASGSKKIDCPFELVATYNNMSGRFEMDQRKPYHNHSPTRYMEGHAHVRRLSGEQEQFVEQLWEQNMPPRHIHSTLKKQWPGSVFIRKTIYNVIDKIKRKKKMGSTPIEVLENYLRELQFIFSTREDPKTNITQEVFFISPQSYTTWRAFPHVLMIDATYKTNMYKLPFVQMIGVTSTGNSFLIASAFITYEREDNYTWVLERLKEILEGCYMPRVILTDKDLALVNACGKVFPDASRQLCRWHIQENIFTNCRQKFSNRGVYTWDNFTRDWSYLCESSNEQLYQMNRNNIYKGLVKINRPDVLEYLDKNWLTDRFKVMFISAWTNKARNFGQHTTSRVESEHAALKLYLKTTNASLQQLVKHVHGVVDSQTGELRAALATSKIKVMRHHRNRMFDYLRGRVSHKCLDLLDRERDRMGKFREMNVTCGCQLFTGSGLPCACRLERYEQTGIMAHRRRNVVEGAVTSAYLNFAPGTSNQRFACEIEDSPVKQRTGGSPATASLQPATRRQSSDLLTAEKNLSQRVNAIYGVTGFPDLDEVLRLDNLSGLPFLCFHQESSEV